MFALIMWPAPTAVHLQARPERGGGVFGGGGGGQGGGEGGSNPHMDLYL